MPYYDTVNKVLEKKVVVPTTGWTALRYGTTNAEGRRYIGIFNRSPYKIFITTDNNNTAGTSLTTDAAHVRAIRAGGSTVFPYSDKVTVYARSRTGGATVIVTEECN
jgi:hypothetical protein